jgi:outer membrane protein
MSNGMATVSVTALVVRNEGDQTVTPLLILFALPLGQAAPTMTVEEAVQIALKEGFSVRQAQILERRSQDLIDLAKVGAGLNVNLQGSYTRIEQREVKESAFAGGGQPGGPQQDTGSLTLAVTQYVDVTGAIRKAVNQARFNKTAAKLSTEAAQNAIKAIVRSQALAVLETQEQVTIQMDELKAARERLDKAQARLRAEAIPRFDVLRLETDLRRVEQALVTAQQNAALAKQDLNNTLGREIDTPFEMAPIQGAASQEGLDASALTQFALKRRPDILAAEATLKGQLEAVGRQKLGLGPQLVLSASHTETLTQIAVGSPKGQTVGAVTVTLPLYDSGLTKTNVRSAEKDAEATTIQLEQTRLGAALDVRAALTRLTSANEAYQTALKTEELSKEALRLAQLRYDEGVGILLDVIEAQTQVTAARSSAAAARFATLAALAQLQLAVGFDDLRTATPDPKETAS